MNNNSIILHFKISISDYSEISRIIAVLRTQSWVLFTIHHVWYKVWTLAWQKVFLNYFLFCESSALVLSKIGTVKCWLIGRFLQDDHSVITDHMTESWVSYLTTICLKQDLISWPFARKANSYWQLHCCPKLTRLHVASFLDKFIMGEFGSLS